MVRLIEVVGSLNIDLVSTTPRVPGPGETLQASSFSTGFGGKGANQAVACVRMLDDHVRSSGNAVRMVGAVGKDQFGDDFISQLKSEGISPAAVRSVDGLTTGSTIIIVEQSTGENRILFTPAANFSLKPNFVDAQPGLQPGHGLVVFQLEIPFDTVLAGLRTAKQLGKETVFNPAPAKPLPGATYKVIDHLIVNESEASILSGTSEGNLAASLDHVAQSFINKGVTTVVITLGSKGVYWLSDVQVQANEVGSTMGARKVKAVDTTAAGDTFVRAYVAHLSDLDGKPTPAQLRSAIEFATRAASVAVTKSGAQASIPLANELPPAGA